MNDNSMNNNCNNYDNSNLNNNNQQDVNNNQGFNLYNEPSQVEQQKEQPIENIDDQSVKKNNSELKTFVIMVIIIFIAVMLYPYVYDFIKSIRFN